MSAEIKSDLNFEIGHVLFIDIVGYSKLLINQQHETQEKLNHIVRGTEQFRNAEAGGDLIRLPTGDGMALVFSSSPEAPMRCALEISKALQRSSDTKVRMGIHSGPVTSVIDVNDRSNVAGAGINMALRVMSCGDAGHILLSKHVADDLEQYSQWRPHLRELGDCEVKHGVKVAVVNFYDGESGNARLPEKFAQAKQKERAAARRRNKLVALGLIGVAGVIGAIWFWLHRADGVASSALARSTINDKSIAVLPFENRSDDKQNAYFADGIQDEILTQLVKISDLKVISRTSTQQYQSKPGNLSEIARQLGVANILEGSVQKVGDQVHINVQLIRAASDSHLWADSYNRKIDNVLSVQNEVATAVAEALKAELTAPEQAGLLARSTSNGQAYNNYLRGLAFFREGNAAGFRKATSAFEEAAGLDPNFAAAWALLARMHSLLYFSNDDATPARREAAQRALANALRLNPELAEVQLAQAYYQYWIERDYDGARSTFEHLRKKLPNSAEIAETLGYITRRQGRWDESRAYIDAAVVLNPRYLYLRSQAAALRLETRDFPAALEQYDAALHLWPNDGRLIAGKASVYQSLGRLDEADKLLDGLHPHAEDSRIVRAIYYQAILRRRYPAAIALLRSFVESADSAALPLRDVYRTGLGDLQRLSGDRVAASESYSRSHAALEEDLKSQAENTEIISTLAMVEAGLGDGTAAMKYADRAVSLISTSKDALNGSAYEEIRVRIAARFGNRELVIPALERLLKTPNAEPPLTPALLRLDPDFDALRADASFQKLCQGEKP